MLDRPVAFFDQRAGNPAPAQIAGERKSDGTGTDDQDGGVGRHSRTFENPLAPIVTPR